MNRLCAAVVAFCIVAALSGCAALHNSSAPLATATPAQMVTFAPTPLPTSPTPSSTPSPMPDATTAQPVGGSTSDWTSDDFYKLMKIVPTTNTYTSMDTGITFTVPNSWIGKYRVEEQQGYATVYFNPAGSINTDVGDGELFSINPKDSEEDELLYSYAVEFKIDETTYICGELNDACYQKGQPEYDTYKTMQKDLPAVFESIRTSKGQMPDNIIKNPKPAPMNLVYTSTKLNITFSMPNSWKGKYRVEEGDGCINVSFKPKKPLTKKNGDGWLFIIEKKTDDTADDEEMLDCVKEVNLNGITYICGTPTDVSYEGPEDETFQKMNSDVWAIFDSIRAAPSATQTPAATPTPIETTPEPVTATPVPSPAPTASAGS